MKRRKQINAVNAEKAAKPKGFEALAQFQVESQHAQDQAPYGLSTSDWEAILGALVDCRYNLFLGAGASFGALGGDADGLPLAEQLRKDICSVFGLDESEIASLSEAYEEATVLQRADSSSLVRYMKERFTNCKPKWQASIFNVPWKRIWSLNIDDVCEAASETHKAPLQRLVPIDWTEPFSDTSDSSDVQFIYLHGVAKHIGTDGHKLIFSIEEYANATASQQTWHKIFTDVFYESPFVVIGSKLKDEVDLAAAVRRGNYSRKISGTPSLYVSPTITKTERDRLERWGFTCITATGEQFFETISKSIGERLSADARDAAWTSRQFAENFDRLTEERDLVTARRADFWSGVEPIWNDALDNQFVRLTQYSKLNEKIETSLKDMKHVGLWLVTGAPGAGKTAIMFVAARALQSHGVEVWQFRGRRRLDIRSLLAHARPNRTYALIFDNAADFVADIDTLCDAIESMRTLKPRIIVLLADRTKRLDGTNIVLQRADAHKFEIQKLNRVDVELLIERLEAVGKLGVITGLDREKQIGFFIKKNDGSLFDGLMDLEIGSGYKSRVLAELNDVKLGVHRTIVAATAIVHSFGYPLPITILCRAFQIKYGDIFEIVSGDSAASEFLEIEKVGSQLCTKTLHRRRAEIMVSAVMSPQERFRIAISIARACALHLSLKTIQRRELPYYIVRHLLDRTTADDWFGGLAKDWYAELEQLYGWNARFWEQRALLESGIGNHETATSYARTAQSKHEDLFTLNTLGTVLLNQANESKTLDASERALVFKEGVAYLLRSRQLANSRGDVQIHPYITFFTKTIRFRSMAITNASLILYLNTTWDDWMSEATSGRLKKIPEFVAQIEQARSRWLGIKMKEQVRPK